jgi:phospholipase/carboxylesterase
MKISRYEAAGLKCIEVAPVDAEGRDLPLIICMHGRGDWGESYVDIAPFISRDAYRFVFPTAGLTLGEGMFEWFELDQLNLGPGAAEARVQVTALVNELRERYQTPADRVALGGFSQGGMMTLEVGLRYTEKLAGLFPLSCFLVADSPFNWANPDPRAYYANAKGDLSTVLAAARPVPIFQAHGIYDPVIPVMAGRATHALLEKAGLAVEYHEFAGMHEISLDELEKLKKFLTRCLGPGQA